MTLSTVDVSLVTREQAELLAAPPASAVSLLPVPQMRAALAEYDSRRRSFREWLLSQLREGIHFGVPPGCEPKVGRDGLPVDFSGATIRPEQWQFKPSLYKAGADFLCDLMMLDPTFEPDVETWKMLGGTQGLVVIRCRLLSRGDSPFFPGRPKGDVIGEGRGAAQAGVKRRDANGAVKMAQKSSKVDSIINALGISDLFTQDVEDQARPSPSPDADPSAPKVGTRAERAAERPVNGAPAVTAADLNALKSAWEAKRGLKGTVAEFAAWAKGVLRTDASLAKPSDWDLDAIDVCREAL